jgi:hypothetical protein
LPSFQCLDFKYCDGIGIDFRAVSNVVFPDAVSQAIVTGTCRDTCLEDYCRYMFETLRIALGAVNIFSNDSATGPFWTFKSLLTYAFKKGHTKLVRYIFSLLEKRQSYNCVPELVEKAIRKRVSVAMFSCILTRFREAPLSTRYVIECITLAASRCNIGHMQCLFKMYPQILLKSEAYLYVPFFHEEPT